MRCLIILMYVTCSAVAPAQDYHVVIGSFSTENSAIKFAGYASSLRYDARYLQNSVNGLYYVYVLKTKDRNSASELTIRLQNETEFEDAWMYYGGPTVPVEDIKTPPKEVVKTPPVEVPKTLPVEVVKVTEPEIKETGISIEKPVEKVEETPEDEPVREVAVEEKAKISFDGPVKPVAQGKFFKFILTTANGKNIQSKVYNVDRQQGRDLAAYNANEYVDVLRPSIQGMPITIVCEVFGYNSIVKVIDYNDPGTFEGVTQDENGVWIVPFTLDRLKKGDVSVMYKLGFYKDAVIMLPSSKPELDELVNMMKLNPNYKIKIHGHNNGNEKSIRIITLGSDKNYFGMARSLSKTGSAKELSHLRAETIKSYLTDRGIDKSRIDTYAWGGTVMLVKPGTAAATRLNNRIEIEILED